MKKAHSKNFKGKIKRRDIPPLCASCHSNPDIMRPFGLGIDQFIYYRSSIHGKLWQRGDTSSAVCTDCHGVHDILSPKDPLSPTSPQMVVNTCARCHSKEGLMKRYGISNKIPDDYKRSIHYKRISEGGTGSPTCITCHGSHGAAPPGVRQVEEICGTCHPLTAKSFDLSPHKKAFEKERLPQCTTCHGNHFIKRYNSSNFMENCGQCHDKEERAFTVGESIQALFLSTEELIKKANNSFEEALSRGIPLLDLKPRLNDAKTYMVESYPLFHSISVDTLEKTLRKARSIADDVLSEIHERESKKREKVYVLVLFWFYVLLTVGLIEAKKRIDKIEE